MDNVSGEAIEQNEMSGVLLAEFVEGSSCQHIVQHEEKFSSKAPRADC